MQGKGKAFWAASVGRRCVQRVLGGQISSFAQNKPILPKGLENVEIWSISELLGYK